MQSVVSLMIYKPLEARINLTRRSLDDPGNWASEKALPSEETKSVFEFSDLSFFFNA